MEKEGLDEKGRGSGINRSAPAKVPRACPQPRPQRSHRGLRARFFAWLLAHGSDMEERHYDLVRQRIVGGLGGPGKTVVELGPGAGPNAAHLARGTRWVCIEPNPHFHPHLRRAAAERGLDIEIQGEAAEALPLPDASADAVVCTLVLCSVDDVMGVLREALRVLEPGGLFAFIEHVGAPPGSALRWWQKTLQPAWGLLADGCHPARDTEAAIRAAGFERVETEPFDLPMGLARPHIAGFAWKEGGATES
jgi:ubiquinone/menaquinone biosynthesis C-methylase UbiE